MRETKLADVSIDKEDIAREPTPAKIADLGI